MLGNEKIIVAVVDRLKDQNTDVRQAAVHVLKAMGKNVIFVEACAN